MSCPGCNTWPQQCACPAEPFTADELAVVRDVIDRYNSAGSTVRRLLATLDQAAGERTEAGR